MKVTQEKRDLIGKAKDVAACGVLCASLSELFVGIAVFGPYVASK